MKKIFTLFLVAQFSLVGLVWAKPATALGQDLVFKIDTRYWTGGGSIADLRLQFRGITNASAFSIDWGKSGVSAEIPSDAQASAGVFQESFLISSSGFVFTITVTNTDSGQKIGFGGQSSSLTGTEMITEVVSWPDWLNDTSGAFNGASNLTLIPSGFPSDVTDMSHMFAGASSLNDADITSFDTTEVTDTSFMFKDASSFNQDISGWNLAKTTNMESMFQGASAFNQEIGANDQGDADPTNDEWNVESVTSMKNMFAGASAFNGDITGWQTISATDISGMFDGASSFNQNIASWDVTDVTDMGATFRAATSFNQSLDSWDVANVADMTSMFEGSAYTGAVSSWDTSSLNAMASMFKGTDFNGTFGSNWDTSSVSNFDSVFQNADVFNQSLANWNTSSATSMVSTFQNAQSFSDSSVESWNVSSVTDFTNMFKDAISFEQDLSSWVVSSAQKMQGMFEEADRFTGTGLSSWTTSSLTDLGSMFDGAGDFNANIDSWDVDQVTDMSYLFRSAVSFNQPLNSWDTSSVVGAGFESILDGATSFNQSLNSWDVSGTTNLRFMFQGATSFNGAVDAWDVSNATTLNSLFRGATAFDQDISSWDTGNVGNFSGVFFGASSFDQDISSWDTGNVLLMDSTFKNATSFNRDLNDWDVSSLSFLNNAFEEATSFSYCLPDWNISSISSSGRENVFLNITGYDTGTDFDFSSCSAVTHKFQDGVTPDKVSYIQSGAGFSVPQPAIPPRAGFTSLGFFDAASGGSSVTFPTVFPADETLYAQWATQPAAPTGLTATSGYEKVSLSWTAPADDGNAAIVKYVVGYKTPDGSYTYVDSAGTSLEVTGLTNGQEYLFKVAAINNEVTDNTNYSDANFTSETSSSAVNADPDFTLLNETATSSDIGSTTSQSYSVVDDSGNLISVVVTSSDTSTVEPSVVLTGKDFVVTYTWKKVGGATITVAVTDGDGSVVSKTLSAAIPTIPGKPTSVAGTAGDSQVALSWTTPASDGFSAITGYKIEQSTDNTTWTELSADTGSTSTSFTSTGLTNGTEYYFRISAINSVGTGLASDASVAIVPQEASPPSSGGSGSSSGGSPQLIVADNQQLEIIVGASRLTILGSSMNLATEVRVGETPVEILEKDSGRLVISVGDLSVGEYSVVIKIGASARELESKLIVTQEGKTEPATGPYQKVNAGSFKGFVAVYARGHEGSRLSAKVGRDWIVVDPILNNQSDTLFRVTDFTGAGYEIKVRIYINRVLVDTINLTTR